MCIWLKKTAILVSFHTLLRFAVRAQDTCSDSSFEARCVFLTDKNPGKKGAPYPTRRARIVSHKVLKIATVKERKIDSCYPEIKTTNVEQHTVQAAHLNASSSEMHNLKHGRIWEALKKKS